MSIIEIFALAVALSIDASVVSFTQGLIFNDNRVKNSLILAFAVGLFQFLMPLLGGIGVSFVQKIVEPFAPFIVCFIFIFLGIKFIKEALEETEKVSPKISSLSFKYILLVAIATSIDALAAGI